MNNQNNFTVEKYNKFTILHQNIRSMRSNFDGFLAELSSRSFFPEIIVLSEIWIDNSELNFYTIPNYTSYIQSNELQRAGGVLIYVKSSIEVIICDQVEFQSADILKLDFKFNCQDFCLFAIYRFHSYNKEIFLREFIDYFTKNDNFITKKNAFFIGDVNLNLFEISLIVDNYISFFAANGFENILTEPTRVTADTVSCIDHVFAKLSNKDKTEAIVEVIDANITDHRMVVVSVRVSVRAADRQTDRTAESQEQTSHRVDYDKLLALLDSVDWSDVYFDQNPSSAFDTFHSKLQKAISESRVNIIKRDKNILFKIKPWMNNYICMKIKNKNKLYEKVRNHPNNRKLLIHFKNYRNKLQFEIRNLKQSYYENMFTKCNGNSKATWKAVNEVTGQRARKPAIKSLNINGIEVDGTNIICNEFNNFFLSVVDKLDIKQIKPCSFDSCYLKNKFAVTNYIGSMFVNPVLADDIINVIKSLKNGTSPGIDNISSSLIKIIYPKILNVLVHLVNLSFERGIFPDVLKIAVVIPLHKNGPVNNCNNYRPISLLSTFAKIFEKLMKKQLVNFLEQTNFFSRNQFGFRENLNTEAALMNFMDEVYIGLNNGKRVSGIFLDIKKAFDTVDHKFLLNKLESCGVRGIAYSWFESYLTKRKQRVKIANTFSEFGVIKNGVPQGSVLGAILFLIYINDLCNANLIGKVTSFADDTALCYVADNWNDIEEAMNTDMRALQWWFTSNNMLLSPEKTKYINFNLRNEHTFNNGIIYKCSECLIKNSQCLTACAVVSQTNTIKYLGLTLDQELNWKKHVEILKKKLNTILRYFYFLQHLCSEKILRMLYFSLVNSRLDYGIFCWGGTYETNLKPILMQQKKFVRIIKRKSKLEPSRPLFVNLKIFPLNYLFVYKVLNIFYILSGNLPKSNNMYKEKLRKPEAIKVPKPNTTFFTKSYCFLGPKMFNSIPESIADSRNLILFKKNIKIWLINCECVNFLFNVQL